MKKISVNSINFFNLITAINQLKKDSFYYDEIVLLKEPFEWLEKEVSTVWADIPQSKDLLLRLYADVIFLSTRSDLLRIESFHDIHPEYENEYENSILNDFTKLLKFINCKFFGYP